MPGIIWLRTDEIVEAIKSLEKSYQSLLEIEDDIYQWKWFIIAFHNTLQAFMVLALKGSASVNVLKNREKWYEVFYLQKNYPKEQKLDAFLTLYERIKSKDMVLYGNSRVFESDQETDIFMTTLNEYRNGFIHFVPCHKSMAINELPIIFRKGVLIITFLLFESGNIYYRTYAVAPLSSM